MVANQQFIYGFIGKEANGMTMVAISNEVEV
jgi:hypothetical protein